MRSSRSGKWCEIAREQREERVPDLARGVAPARPRSSLGQLVQRQASLVHQEIAVERVGRERDRPR